MNWSVLCLGLVIMIVGATFIVNTEKFIKESCQELKDNGFIELPSEIWTHTDCLINTTELRYFSFKMDESVNMECHNNLSYDNRYEKVYEKAINCVYMGIGWWKLMLSLWVFIIGVMLVLLSIYGDKIDESE